MEREGLDRLKASTQIMITPLDYEFRIVHNIVTNFHQPKSTLLLLVSAFVGDGWRRIYDYALGHGFRFLSYGDSSELLRECPFMRNGKGTPDEDVPFLMAQGRIRNCIRR